MTTYLSKSDFLSKITPNAILELNSGSTDYPYYVQVCKIAVQKEQGKIKVLLTDGIRVSTGIVTDFTLMKQLTNASNPEFFNFKIMKIMDCVISAAGPNKTLVLLASARFTEFAFSERIYTNPEQLLKIHESNLQRQIPDPENLIANEPQKRIATPTKIQRPQKPNYQLQSNSSPFKPNSTSLMTVSAINAYSQTMRVRARCTQKSEMRPFKNGNGKLFSLVLVDSTGDIKATAFNEDADRLFTQLEQFKIYIFNKFRAKPADQRYNKTSHSYEITFNKESTVELVEDDDPTIPQVTWNFIENISVLQSKAAGDFVDVVAIVHDIGELQTINRKSDGSELSKRDLTLVDSSNMQIKLTLWGEKALEFEVGSIDSNSVICAKSLKVGEYNGRTLSTASNSVLCLTENNDKTESLHQWYSLQSNNEFIPFASSYKKQKKDDYMWIHCAMAMPIDQEKGFWFTAAVTIGTVFVKGLYYSACPSCKKKIIEVNGGWRCEKCSEDHDVPSYKYISSLNVIDCSGQHRVQCFDDIASVIFGTTANELHNAIKDLTELEKELYMQNITNQKQFMMKCLIKMEYYNDENRKKITVKEVEQIDYLEYGNRLSSMLDTYDS
eukprot:NODE_552_length_6806_cov_0.530938.p1 type:complete len:611 gc:universal NODE_552_length_6806_cov_0.530938:2639-4471(+)